MICDTSLLGIAAAIAEDETLYRAAKLGVLIKTVKEVDSDAAT